MRTSKQNAFAFSGFFKLKGQDWLDKQRIAGKIAAQALMNLQSQVENKTTHSLLELNNITEEFITKAGGELTFKNYKGFPAGVCISVNKELVHGIPKDIKLQDGDVVSFDLGVTVEGAIADTAITCIYGTPKSDRHVELIKTTEEALMKGIEAISVGKKLGCIGFAINKCAKGYGLITKYGGHGISWNTPHDTPFVENKSTCNEGIRIQPGLTIAIEPMLVIGDTYTYVDKDGWTVCGMGISAHFEHTVFIHENTVEIITDRSKL